MYKNTLSEHKLFILIGVYVGGAVVCCCFNICQLVSIRLCLKGCNIPVHGRCLIDNYMYEYLIV